MHKKSIFAILILTLFPLVSTATGKVSERIASIFNSESLKNASTSICAITSDGDTLVNIDSHKMLVPASILKLVTTALAMEDLGPDYRWKTEICHDGQIKDGILHGNLYIRGGGDPTTCSEDSIATPTSVLFRQWTDIIRKAGIKTIDGYIIGDGDCFDGLACNETWQHNDIGTYYGTGTSGLSFYENKIDFRLEAGSMAGDGIKVTQLYPLTPWMNYRNECTTGKAGTGNSIYLYTSDYTVNGVFRGSFAVNRKPKTEKVANRFPEFTCASYFNEYLKSAGIVCTKGPMDTKGIANVIAEKTVKQDAGRMAYGCGRMNTDTTKVKSLGYTTSPSLQRVAAVTNMESNNFYAETLFKTLGMEHEGKGNYESSIKVADSLLTAMGLKKGTVKMTDGCGLSRQNYISAAATCELLQKISKRPYFDKFLLTLPRPGGNGSLNWILKNLTEQDKLRIRMKSGSMSGIKCYSGYIMPRKDSGKKTIIFSIMINNYTARNAEVQSDLEKIITLLAL